VAVNLDRLDVGMLGGYYKSVDTGRRYAAMNMPRKDGQREIFSSRAWLTMLCPPQTPQLVIDQFLLLLEKRGVGGKVFWHIQDYAWQLLCNDGTLYSVGLSYCQNERLFMNGLKMEADKSPMPIVWGANKYIAPVLHDYLTKLEKGDDMNEKTYEVGMVELAKGDSSARVVMLPRPVLAPTALDALTKFLVEEAEKVKAVAEDRRKFLVREFQSAI
jgi:hypothetical protein